MVLIIAAGITAALLPFVVLVRGAVSAYQNGWPTWLAVLGGILLAAAVTALLGWLVARRLPYRPGWRTLFLTLALPATVGFAGHGLLTLADAHGKAAAERADWRRTHPLLRLSVAVIALVDRDLVITDLGRDLADYEAWGRTPFEQSRHLRQSDGYGHAMDLRTRGHGLLRNGLLQAYFRAMGFRTLRHVGTADHLHVALPGRRP